MGFPKMRDLWEWDYWQETTRRQKESAKRTNAIRREKAEKKIFTAIEECQGKK
jgi:hypothetical protein